MAENFIPLADLLAAKSAAARAPEAAAQPEAGARETSAALARDGGFEAPLEDLLRDCALARLAVFEAFERARVQMLEGLARDVLGRELALAPADLDALTVGALRTFAELEPVALVLSPADAARVQSPLPVRADRTLEPGDLLIEVRDGTLDARLAVRLHGVIEGLVA